MTKPCDNCFWDNKKVCSERNRKNADDDNKCREKMSKIKHLTKPEV